MAKLVSAFVFLLLVTLSPSLAGPNDPIDTKIYKILLPTEWAEFSSSGHFRGNSHDVTDGFIHFSGRGQIDRVLSKYYKDVKTVYIVEYKTSTFGSHLKWEPASNGDLYPHVYGLELQISDADAVEVRDLEI